MQKIQSTPKAWTSTAPWLSAGLARLCGMSLLLLGLAACHISRGGSAPEQIDAISVGSQGVWILKSDAEELRSTGKLLSLCEEMKKDPHSNSYIYMNVRFVETSGTTYIYDPRIDKVGQVKLGVIGPSGTFIPTPLLKGRIGDASVKVVVSGDKLTFSYTYRKSFFDEDYLRSSEQEVSQYYSAQEACKN
jgi:hypothetical protein